MTEPIKDKPVEGEYKAILDAQFKHTINEASIFAQFPLPTLDNEVRAFVYRNLQHQEALSNLESNLRFFTSRLIVRMKKIESKYKEDARLEGARTKDEQNAGLYKNAKWVDIHLDVENYQILINRVVSLGWILKSSYSYVSK